MATDHVTTLTYQGYDLQSITDALGRTTSYAVDTLGRRISAQDPMGNVMLVQYDADDRITQSTDHLNHTTTVSYDGNSNPLSVTLPSTAVISETYDARNRPLTRTADQRVRPGAAEDNQSRRSPWRRGLDRERRLAKRRDYEGLCTD